MLWYVAWKRCRSILSIYTKYENYINGSPNRIHGASIFFSSDIRSIYSQNVKIISYPRNFTEAFSQCKNVMFWAQAHFLHICVWNYFLPFIWKETLQNSAVKRKHEFIAPITWNLCFYIFKFYSHIRIFSKEALACQTDKVWN